MSKQDHIIDSKDQPEFLQSTGDVDADFVVDEPDKDYDAETNSLDHEVQPSGTTDDPSISTEVDSAEPKAQLYKPRHSSPSHILFLPNMASRTTEKELADFADQLPCKAKKTFMYMSDTAYHGFVECTCVEDATQNLEFINSHNLTVRNKRVLAEYSKRKNVQDRRTYENRQHARKEEDTTRRRGEPRPRRRSRTPPRRRSPPRDYPREDRYRREYPPADYRQGARYEQEPPSYRREFDDRHGYPRQAPRYETGPRPRDDYPAYDDYRRPAPESYPSRRPERSAPAAKMNGLPIIAIATAGEFSAVVMASSNSCSDFGPSVFGRV